MCRHFNCDTVQLVIYVVYRPVIFYEIKLVSLLCTDCRETELGLEYMGTRSTTEHGYTCQAWASDTPHNPYPSAQDDSNYPDGSREAASNYCRNPDRDPGGLWCHTTDPSVIWEYCVIPLCPGRCITFIVLY